MKRIVLAALAASMTMAAPMAQAQPGRDHGDYHDHNQGRGDFHRHDEWRKGYHMQRNDWDRGERVDWHARNLHRPPHGYEWRRVDGNYVMAAVATGLIASVIANAH